MQMQSFEPHSIGCKTVPPHQTVSQFQIRTHSWTTEIFLTDLALGKFAAKNASWHFSRLLLHFWTLAAEPPRQADMSPTAESCRIPILKKNTPRGLIPHSTSSHKRNSKNVVQVADTHQHSSRGCRVQLSTQQCWALCI